MISGLILTLGSIFFMLLLFMVYFSQNNQKTIETKLYKYMIITILILLLTEVGSSTIIYYSDNDLLKVVASRIHWFTGFVWFYLLYFYSITFISDIEVESFKKYIFLNKKTKIMTIFTIVVAVIYMFVPFSKLDKVSYLPGPASYYVLSYCAISILCIIVHTFVYGKAINFRKRMAIYVQATGLALVVTLQIMFPEIAFEAIGAAIQMFFLYFNIENPDIKNVYELEVVKDDIERSNKAKSDFLSNMSNEIVHPMNTIINYSEMILKEKEYNEEITKKYISEISSSGSSLLDIIDNILNISTLESSNDTLDLKEYSMVNVLKDLVSVIHTRLGEKQVEFLLDIDSNIPSRLLGDYNKIYQVLLNLLTNAVKYTDVGKIKLTIKCQNSAEGCLLMMKVSDTGCGIKKEDYDKLFVKFNRLESDQTKRVEGTGLGLAITKKYVDLMNGNISFDSEYGAGSTFYVDINQKIINSNPIGEVADLVQTKEKIKKIDCSKYTILIVDDDELSLKVTKRILGAYNFNIETLSSGRECIYNIKAEKHYDMIFMDHMMHNLDGIETLHKIKKLDGYTIPPVVALTANAITGMREMYLNEGFDEYLPKPIRTVELNNLILKYFDKE